MRQIRGAFDWSGADVPGLRPSTSHHPSGVVAVFDWPGLILPKMSSLLSRNELSLLVAARTRNAGALPLFLTVTLRVMGSPATTSASARSVSTLTSNSLGPGPASGAVVSDQ